MNKLWFHEADVEALMQAYIIMNCAMASLGSMRLDADLRSAFCPSARTGAEAAEFAACSAWYAAVVARFSPADMWRHIMGAHVFGLPDLVMPCGIMRLPNASYA